MVNSICALCLVVLIIIRLTQGVCNTLPTLYGTVTTTCTTSQVENTQCTYTCDSGYHTIDGTDSVTITCNVDGSWSTENVVGQLSVSLVQQSPLLLINTTDLQLDCTVNLPSNDATVEWSLDGQVLPDTATPTDSGVTLTRINPDPISDSGVYVCSATTGDATDTQVIISSASISIDVQVPATISEEPMDQNTPLTQTVVFDCVGHGKSIAALTWYKDETRVSL
ncbi:uncharacterized protein LOC144436831 [Glandiceps talaboti]